MLKGIRDFIDKENRVIKSENRKIHNLHKEIEDDETLIYIIEKSGRQELVAYYKEKIEQHSLEIDRCIEKINNSRNRIIIMKSVNRIVKRGEKCA